MFLGFAVVVIGYLLGSIPSAYLVARHRSGVDIREVGVGNMGAANVFREVGRWEGAFVWAIDVAKGSTVMLIAQALDVSLPWLLGAGLAAMLGHSFPAYIGFRGGKGAATTMGIFLVLAPEAMAITFVLLAIPYYFTRRIFYAICIVSPILPLLVWQFEGSIVLALYAVSLIIFMGIRNLPSLQEIRTLLVEVKNRFIPDSYDEDD